MANKKWIDVCGDTPLVTAARKVLALRLGAVRDFLLPALYEAGQDPENVHQLRVSTRRAGAAVRVFRPCLPNSLGRQLRRTLRRWRRAAGAARDWDVFFATLASRIARVEAKQRPGLEFLLGYCKGQRAAAQQALLATLPKAVAKLDRLLAKTDRALRPLKSRSHGRVLRDLAVPTLTHLLQNLEEAASQDLHLFEHLHRVRILGKRLRYAMEILAGCFSEPFRREYYEAVVAMQDILGQANDSYVAAQRLTSLTEQLALVQPKLWKRWQPGLGAYLHFHQTSLPRQRSQFLKWWQRWQQSGKGKGFAGLLKQRP